MEQEPKYRILMKYLPIRKAKQQTFL